MARELALSLRFWVPVVAGVALLVRFPFLFGPHQVPPDSDDEFFLRVAARLLDGDGDPGHFWMPGYMAFEAVVSLLPGRTADAVTIVQHLLGVGVCVGMLVVAWRWFGRVPAVVASLLAAASPMLVVHEHRLLPDFFFGVVVCAGAVALAAAVRAETPRTRLLVLAGVLFGLAVWVKAAGVFLVAAAPLALLLVTRSPRATLRGAAVVTAALVITISPWLARNWERYGDPHLTVQGGQALFYRVFEVDAHTAPRRLGRRPLRPPGPGADPRATPISTTSSCGRASGSAARPTTRPSDVERRLALQGVREHPGSYLVGTVREFGEPARHIRWSDRRVRAARRPRANRPAVPPRRDRPAVGRHAPAHRRVVGAHPAHRHRADRAVHRSARAPRGRRRVAVGLGCAWRWAPPSPTAARGATRSKSRRSRGSSPPRAR